MFRTLLAAAAVAVALGACPNQCSGHGWCDENERCVCFKAPGTANQHLTFIGPDCSQRVCPYGRTHDLISDSTQELTPIWGSANPFVGFIAADGASSSTKLVAFLNGGLIGQKDLGLDVRVVSVNPNNIPYPNIKFQWKTNTQKTFGAEVEAVVSSDAGTYTSRALAFHVRPDNADTGLYIYFDVANKDDLSSIANGDKYFLNVTFNDGVKFVTGDANTAHQLIECSGRGTCDRSAGQCKCVAGYTGDACQRTICPNDCSGHGICQAQKYFVQDAATAADLKDLSYGGFDADSAYGCKCDIGFRGADCSQRECPSGADPMKGDGGAQGLDCSGRGLCDYTTGVCKCFKGFFGERCEELSTLV